MKKNEEKTFFTGENVKGNIEAQDIEYFEKLAKIEKYFDIRFKRPDEIYGEELMTVETLINYIDKGCAVIPSLIGCSYEFSETEKEKLEEMIKPEHPNNIYLMCDDTFICNLYGSQIKFDGVVVSGPYTFDKDDVQKKVESFMAGDIRSVKFELVRDGKTYLMNKESDEEISLIEPYCYIVIGNMKLKWLLFEENDPTKE